MAREKGPRRKGGTTAPKERKKPEERGCVFTLRNQGRLKNPFSTFEPPETLLKCQKTQGGVVGKKNSTT